MIQLLRLLFRQDFLYSFPSKWILITETISVFVGVSVYWLTFQAIDQTLSETLVWHGKDYFSYVVMGELIIGLPLLFFDGIPRNLRIAGVEGFFENLLIAPKNLAQILILLTFSAVPRHIFSFCLTLFFATLVYGMSISINEILLILVFQLVSLPVFIGLGLLGAGLIIVFGRGQAVIAQISFLFTLLAGVFFPLTVFPEALTQIILKVLPFSTIVENCRLAFEKGLFQSGVLEALGTLIVQDVFYFTLGWILLFKSIGFYKRRGSSLIVYQ